ncbi:DUF6172 family protein [Arcobacteraceae bacterium]|nr:DUF6172 family protein [Arcobacteraceae bacterium]
MKKTYQLTATNKEPARVVEAIKNEIRKYIKREKRKTLPEGMNFWNMDCKFGQNDAEPETIAFQDITKCIDEAVDANCKSIYLELLSSAIKKERKVEEIIAEDENEVIVEETISEETIEENTNIEPNDKI